MTLKKFLRGLFLSFLICSGPVGSAASSKSPFLGWAILQGITDDKNTVFAVLHEEGDLVEACVGKSHEKCESVPSETSNQKRTGSPWQVTHFKFKNLPSDFDALTIKNNHGQKDERDFGFLNLKNSIKFAVISCMDDSYSDVQGAMWKSVFVKKPDILFLIGDNSYADKGLLPHEMGTPLGVWKRYAETRSLLEVFRAKKLVPIYATWDDHDFGVNDGDSSYVHKEEAKETFKAFFPQGTLFGVASPLTLAGQDFLFLDDRTFRSKPGVKEYETHWGKEQEAWVLKSLRSNSHPTWLINGDQFFGGYHEFESYEGTHPKSFKKFLTDLRLIKKPVHFISGDRHLAEVMKINPSEFGREAFELTSSAIHAKTFPGSWDKKKNPRQVKGVSGVLNYMIVESAVEKKELKVKLSSYSAEEEHFNYEFTSKR